MKTHTAGRAALILLTAFAPLLHAGAADAPTDAALYPESGARIPSPGRTAYFVDPAKGDDANAGTTATKPWRSFAKINGLDLAPGDKVVVAPGVHTASLTPLAHGTEKDPVVIKFLPGTHEFVSEKLYRRPYFVSNSADKPTHPLPIALFVENARHLKFQGGGGEGPGKTTILLAGPERSTYFVNDHAEDIVFENLGFDLKRPTVSEFRVTEVAANGVLIEIAEGCTYAIKNGKFNWTGDLGSGWTMVQQANPEDRRCWRMGQWDPFTKTMAKDEGESPAGRPLVRLTYEKGNLGMIKGRQFQFRPIDRTVVTAHNTRSKNIVMRNCDIHAFTGMAIVSQFTDGIVFDHVRAAPEKGTLRTCPGWADNFHFSNCRGQITVNDCVFSGNQDDPINVHGTYLRIVGKPAENRLQLRYMQSQTYGFAPYVAGDELAAFDHNKLRELPGNPHRKVIACEPADKTGKEWIVTLDGSAPAYGKDDVVDNINWHPDVTIKNCTVDMSSCRGFLITTRGKVLVEGNTFVRCTMAGILVADDARGWYESTCIRDMTIRKNHFVACGIEINPETTSNDPKEPVHENIRIENNTFDGGGISAKSVKGLVITDNKTPSGGKVSVHLAPSCSEVKME